MAPTHPRKRRPPDDIVLETPPSELMDEQDEPLPPPKRSRQDVKTRIEKNKTLSFFVIKRTLKQFSRKLAEGIEWGEGLKAVDQTIAEAYLFTNFYFFRQLKDADLENASYELMELRGDRSMAKTECLTQRWFPAAAKHMATNANSAIIRNFAKWLRPFVMGIFMLAKKETHAILNGFFAETFAGTYSETDNPAAIDPISIGLRGRIPRTPKNRFAWDAHDLLPIFHQFLIQIGRSNEENKHKEGYREQRTFRLLPT
ncbi:hypothetical protein BBJ28_00013760 [Nothophytophthora sp. Chile5]|nr:hypothetical protein BBJ28_00013760 [Nothophytophthora sp. Chile5]